MFTTGAISDPHCSKGSSTEEVMHEKRNDSDFPSLVFTSEFLGPQKMSRGSGRHCTA